MKNAISKIDFSVGLKPMEAAFMGYAQIIIDVVKSLPVYALIGVPALILFVCFLWFWYNFLR
jgi:hypothetical protein